MTSNARDVWPDDADADVLRRLRDKGFDFSLHHLVDFNVDFDAWPPNPIARQRICREFPLVTEYVDEVSGVGSLVVKVDDMVTYRLVVDTQRRLSELASEFGGWCNSWGVLS